MGGCRLPARDGAHGRGGASAAREDAACQPPAGAREQLVNQESDCSTVQPDARHVTVYVDEVIGLVCTVNTNVNG